MTRAALLAIVQNWALRASQIEMLIGAPLGFLHRSAHANRPTPPKRHANLINGKTRGERKRERRAVSDGKVWLESAMAVQGHIHPRHLRGA